MFRFLACCLLLTWGERAKPGFLILADNGGTQNQGTRVEANCLHRFPHTRVAKWEDVNVSVYSVESHGEAAPWLGGVRNWRVAAGWQVSTYRIGDEGYLFRHLRAKFCDRCYFPRTRFLASVKGREQVSHLLRRDSGRQSAIEIATSLHR